MRGSSRNPSEAVLIVWLAEKLREQLMLTAEKIEKQNYCTNDIADLMMRFQKAYKTIEYMTTELMKIDTPDCFVKEAYQAGLNGLTGMKFEHNCDIQPDGNGVYRCSCDLIADGELELAIDSIKEPSNQVDSNVCSCKGERTVTSYWKLCCSRCQKVLPVENR